MDTHTTTRLLHRGGSRSGRRFAPCGPHTYADAGRPRCMALGTSRPPWRRFRRADREREVDSGFLGVWERERSSRSLDGRAVGHQPGRRARRAHPAEGGRIVCVPELAAEYIPRGNLKQLGLQSGASAACGPHTYAAGALTVLALGPSATRWSASPPGARAAGPARRLARLGVLGYLVMLLVEGVRLARGEGGDCEGSPRARSRPHRRRDPFRSLGALARDCRASADGLESAAVVVHPGVRRGGESRSPAAR